MSIYFLKDKRESQVQTLACLKSTLCALDSTIERAASYQPNVVLDRYLAQLKAIQHNIENDIASIQKKPLKQQPLSFD